MTRPDVRRPELRAEYCKGCGRCIAACAHDCIDPGAQICGASGYVPVALDLERCSGCGLCIDACPEPYGLVEGEERLAGADAAHRARPSPPPPDERASRSVAIPAGLPLVVKGTHAAGLGALLA